MGPRSIYDQFNATFTLRMHVSSNFNIILLLLFFISQSTHAVEPITSTKHYSLLNSFEWISENNGSLWLLGGQANLHNNIRVYNFGDCDEYISGFRLFKGRSRKRKPVNCMYILSLFCNLTKNLCLIFTWSPSRSNLKLSRSLFEWGSFPRSFHGAWFVASCPSSTAPQPPSCT